MPGLSPGPPGTARACPEHLARSWLLARLAGHLEIGRAHVGALLALEDDELIRAVAGSRRIAIERERAGFDVGETRRTAQARGVELLCACEPDYPARLRALEAPPAVLHVAGGLDKFLALYQCDPVAIVGSRHASEYGLEVARSLGRGLAAAGVTVVSGMARGIDAAAQRGALSVGGTIAVLPGPAERAYPPAQRALHRAIVTGGGVALSELPPGSGVRRWCFLARNRLISGLAAMTVVVEAGERSGALPTAETARRLGRAVGAVPGRVTSAQAAGSNALLASGASLVRDTQDVLDTLFGAGTRAAASDPRDMPSPEQARLLEALNDGESVAGALRRAGIPAGRGLAVMSELELTGWIRVGPGGRVSVIP